MKKENISIQGIGFLLLGIGLLVYNSWRSDHQSTVDINLDSMYFVISYPQLRILFCSLLIVFGLIYLVFGFLRKPLNNRLSMAHLFLTIIGSGLFLRIRLRQKPITAYDENQQPIRWDSSIEAANTAISIGLLLMILATILFLINIIITLIKKKNINV